MQLHWLGTTVHTNQNNITSERLPSPPSILPHPLLATSKHVSSVHVTALVQVAISNLDGWVHWPEDYGIPCRSYRVGGMLDGAGLEYRWFKPCNLSTSQSVRESIPE